jgi:amino acid transporter
MTTTQPKSTRTATTDIVGAQSNNTAAPSAFVRNSTGLVREVSLFDALVFNSLGMNVGIGLVLLLVQGLGFFPSASVTLAIIGGTVLTALTAVRVYGEFAAAIPRSGGDYVFVSRTLHPFVGWLLSWSNMIWMAVYWSGFNAWFALTGAVPTALSTLSAATGQQVWQNLSNDLTAKHTIAGITTEWWVLVLGTVINVLFAVMLIRGARSFWRLQGVLFLVAGLALVICAVLMLTHSGGSFASTWNSFAHRNHSLPYNQVIPTAKAAGFHKSGFSLSGTFLLLPWVFFVVGYGTGTAQLGGEIKRASKNQMRSIVGGVFLNGLVMLLLAEVFLHATRSTWAGALSYLSNNDPSKLGLPVTPGFNLVGGVLTSNVALLLVIGIGFVLWALMGTPLNQLQATRYLMAWSLDRTMPESLSDVSEKRHTPVKAIVLTTVTGEIGLVVLLAWQSASLLGALLAQLVVLAIVCIAGVAFPWRLPDVWRSAGARRILGVPTVALAGGVGAVLMIGLIVLMVTNSTLVNVYGATHRLSLYVTCGVLVAGALWYAGAWAVNRRRGIDLSLAYKEIPPE